MATSLPQIVKTANELLFELKRQVLRFPKVLRYDLGSQLVADAFEISVACYDAWCDRGKRDRIEDLDRAITRLKVRLQLAQRLQAFTSTAAFEVVAKLARSLGRQCGGWRKSLQGQSPPASAPAGSAQILSSRPAPLAGAAT